VARTARHWRAISLRENLSSGCGVPKFDRNASRERAYRLYVERGDNSSAARIASYLAADHLLFRGEPAVANGWLQRAHSLIDDLEPSVDHGWLAIHEGHIAVALEEDTAKARQLAARAVELGRTFRAPELEMLRAACPAALRRAVSSASVLLVLATEVVSRARIQD
jgi:hypothetical protein